MVPWRVAILAKLAILAKMANLDGEKSPEGWRLKLDAKSGPLESGDFGEIGDFGKNGKFGWQKIARGLAIEVRW